MNQQQFDVFQDKAAFFLRQLTTPYQLDRFPQMLFVALGSDNPCSSLCRGAHALLNGLEVPGAEDTVVTLEEAKRFFGLRIT